MGNLGRNLSNAASIEWILGIDLHILSFNPKSNNCRLPSNWSWKKQLWPQSSAPYTVLPEDTAVPHDSWWPSLSIPSLPHTPGPTEDQLDAKISQPVLKAPVLINRVLCNAKNQQFLKSYPVYYYSKLTQYEPNFALVFPLLACYHFDNTTI